MHWLGSGLGVMAIVTTFTGELGAGEAIGIRYVGSYSGHCYYLGSPGNVVVGRHEADSLSKALKRKAYLVAVNSLSEESWLVRSIGGQECWIGLSDEEVEGQFVWDSREPVTFTNWGRPGGEPTDFGGCPTQNVDCRCEDHVVINGHLPGPGSHWNDLAGMCWERKGLIEVESCEFAQTESSQSRLTLSRAETNSRDNLFNVFQSW